MYGSMEWIMEDFFGMKYKILGMEWKWDGRKFEVCIAVKFLDLVGRLPILRISLDLLNST